MKPAGHSVEQPAKFLMRSEKERIKDPLSMERVPRVEAPGAEGSRVYRPKGRKNIELARACCKEDPSVLQAESSRCSGCSPLFLMLNYLDAQCMAPCLL